MAAVLLAMAFGMFGVFPLESPAHADDLRSLRATRRQGLMLESFMTGLLVTFLGTPCTAPMLGPAVGFAFLAGTTQIFAFFGALAVGFALPFLMLAIFPGWTNRLQNFKVTSESNKWSKGLAFLLVATMIWLLGVLAGGYGLEAIDRVLWFLLIVAVACWMYGIRCDLFEAAATEKLKKKELAILKETGVERSELTVKIEQAHHESFHIIRKRRLLTAAPLVAIVMLSGSWVLQFDQAQTGESKVETGLIKWQPWSQKAVDDARANGKTVFVDVTAAWCMNCKSNERLILDRPAVADMFTASDVTPIKADYTRRDPAISALLEQHKRVGVPVYLVYPPCSGDPVLLPEILTTDMVRQALTTTGPSLPGGCPKP
jgi:thiol:disulfide interchange protein DsbD